MIRFAARFLMVLACLLLLPLAGSGMSLPVASPMAAMAMDHHGETAAMPIPVMGHRHDRGTTAAGDGLCPHGHPLAQHQMLCAVCLAALPQAPALALPSLKPTTADGMAPMALAGRSPDVQTPPPRA